MTGVQTCALPISAEILVNNHRIGAFGELRAAVLRKFKLAAPIAVAEVELDQIVDLEPTIAVDVKMSKFPSVERDLTVKVAADMPFGRVSNALYGVMTASNLIYEVEPASIYQADTENKNLSFHLKFSSPEHTLDSPEISAIMEKITVEMTKNGAMVI